jgi:hypothetical protein
MTVHTGFPIITSLVDADITATAAELNVLAGVTAGTAVAGKAVVLTTGKVIDELDITAPKIGGVAVGATAAEINKVADVSAFVLELTATAAVGAGVRVLELNHATVVIAATWTVVPNTLFIVKDTSATGTAAHTLTISGGTFNGTNTIATLNARDELLMVWFDSAGRGSVLVNLNSVGLS